MSHKNPMYPTLLVALCLLTFAFGSAVCAQVDERTPSVPNTPYPTVTLSADQLQNFTDCLNAISNQGKVTILVEAAPQSRLPTKEDNSVLLSSAGSASVQNWLKRIANAYDYSVSQPIPSIFLLNKRYTHPTDIPAITLGECKHAMDDIVFILGAYDPQPPDVDINHYIRDKLSLFLNSLSKEQKEAMKDEKHGLSINAMNIEQKGIVQEFTVHSYVHHSKDYLITPQAMISSALLKSSIIGYRNYQGNRYWGMEELLENKKRWFSPLNDPGNVTFLGTGAIVVISRIIANGEDQNLPAAFTPIAEAPQPPAPTLSLNDLATSLQLQTKTTLEVEPYLARKPTLPFGLNYASPTDVWRAAAILYGLRVVVEKNTQIHRMTRRAVARPRSVASISSACLSSLPLPLKNALHLTELDRFTANAQEANATGQIPTKETNIGARKQIEQVSILEFQKGALQILMARSKTNPSPEKDRLICDLSSTEESALASYLMVERWQLAESIFLPTLPPCIEHLDQLVIVGDETHFSVGIPSSYQGQLNLCLGFGNLKTP